MCFTLWKRPPFRRTAHRLPDGASLPPKGETRIVNSWGWTLFSGWACLAYVSPVATIDGVTKEGAAIASSVLWRKRRYRQRYRRGPVLPVRGNHPRFGVYGAVFQRRHLRPAGVFANMFSAEEAQRTFLLTGKENSHRRAGDRHHRRPDDGVRPLRHALTPRACPRCAPRW